MRFIENLGFTAHDCITGFEGVITSVSFDLYGCVAYWLVPPVNKEKLNSLSGAWFDKKRIEISKIRVMDVPSFGTPPGPETKSAPLRA